MKNRITKYRVCPAIALMLSAAGCSPPATQSTSQAPLAEMPSKPAVKLTAAQELAKFCRVCVVDKGEKIEEYFPSRLDTKHNGKTYKLCSDDCKTKFDATPKKYALK